MKFKNFVLSLALMLSLVPTVWADAGGVCSLGMPFLNIEQIVKAMTGITCFEHKNLKTDYAAVCGCMKNLAKDMPQQSEGMYLENRIDVIMDVNSVFLGTNLIKNEKDRNGNFNARKIFRNLKGGIVVGRESTEIKDIENQTKSNKRQSDEVRQKRNNCGYSIDEFRRFSRLPSAELLEKSYQGELSSGQEDEPLWEEYLQKNPDLMAIDVNLPEDRKIAFRSKFIQRIREIQSKQTNHMTLFGQVKVDGSSAVVDNSDPSNNLWLKLDEDFRPGGQIRNIISEFSKESIPRHKELISQSNDILRGKGGFEPNFMHLINNPSLWDLYFKENPDATNGCGLKSVSTKQSGLEAISCVNNVRGFCSLYDSSKDLPKQKDLDKVSKLEFGPLMKVERADNQSRIEYNLQAKLVCDTKMKVSNLIDKDGKPFNAELTVDEFKQHLCKDKDVTISETLKPGIPKRDLTAACDGSDNARLLGFYQRLISISDFNKATNSNLGVGEFAKYRISAMRSFLKEKSKFDLPTENDEDNMTAAVSNGGSFRAAAKILASRTATDRAHFDNLKSLGASSDGAGTQVSGAKTAGSALAGVLPTDVVSQPVISAGYNPTNLTPANIAQAQQQQIVSDEGKKIVETKKQITDLESKKEALAPSNPEADKFEKQIQDLKNQLAASEARYQAALDELKKGNPVVNSDNDKNVTSSNVQRNIASVPNVGTDANMVNTSGGNQFLPQGGTASVSGAGKILGSNGVANAGNTNRALLQANNVDVITGTVNNGGVGVGLILQTVKNDLNEEIGIIADPSVFQSFKNKDANLYERYINEMIAKNIQTLIVRNGDDVLRFKLVPGQNDSYKLEEEAGQMSPSERKYFKKDLTNLLNSTVQLSQ